LGTAELPRIKGELLLAQRVSGSAAAAEDHFRQALDWARRQGAVSWELRAVTNLARLQRDQNGSTEAMELLGGPTIDLPRVLKLPTSKPQRR